MKYQASSLLSAVNETMQSSPDEIAATLRRRHITGRPGTTGNCPLAKLMHNAYGGRFIVGRKFIMRTCGKRTEKMRTPKSLADFVRKFDLSGYPDLIAPPPRVLHKPKPRAKPKTKGKPKLEFPSREAGR